MSEEISEHGRILLTREKEAYTLLLLRHLQAKLGKCEGAKRYLEVISLIPVFFKIAEQTRQYYIYMEMVQNSYYPSSTSHSKLMDKIIRK